MPGRPEESTPNGTIALTLLVERRKPSGEFVINASKPEGSRPATSFGMAFDSCPQYWVAWLAYDRIDFSE